MRRVCFPKICNNTAVLRTDKHFTENVYEDYQKRYTILTEIENFSLVIGVPCHYMHLVGLGVIKKLVQLWFQGPLQVRLVTAEIEKIANLLKRLQTSTPNNSARRPRSLKDYAIWKVTEFRNFLLYSGPVVLKNILWPPLYDNFMSLHIALKISIDPSL